MPRTEQLPLAIFLLLSGFYLLTMSGHTYSPDEETMVAVTRGLASGAGVAVVVPKGAPVAALRPGLEGLSYSPYGVLPSLLSLPLYALGTLAASLGAPALDYATRLAIGAFNGIVTAATAAVLAGWALRLGAGRRWAAGLALLFGLATFAWPYARTFFSEPLAALLLLIAAERAWRVFRQQGTEHRAQEPPAHSAAKLRYAFISGLASGLLLATRIAAGVALPIVGGYMLLAGFARRPRATTRREAIARCLLPLACWLAGLLPGLALLAWYNLARFGTPLASGYASEANLFTTPLAEGLYGLLLSPGKSVLLFAPPLLLALPGGLALWRRGERGVVLLAVGLFLSHLLLYARWGEWQGGGVWGPRFLLPVVAPLLVLGAGLGRRAQEAGRRAQQAGGGLLKIAVALLAGLGFVGNLGGVLLNFGTYVVAAEPADKLYSLVGSPLVGHWRTLAVRWSSYLAPPPVCRLGDGLYASESPDGALLPRRSGARGALTCVTAAPLRLGFALDDRRPAAAPASELQLRLAGRELGAPPAGQLRTYRLLLPPGATRLELVARPWNPRAVGFSARDDELGPQLAGLRSLDPNTPLVLADAAIAPLPSAPRPRWAWYYDPPNQHLVDHWAWYLPRSELAGPPAWLAAALIFAMGSTLLVSGAALLRRND